MVRLAAPARLEEGSSSLCGRVELQAPGKTEWGTICHLPAYDHPAYVNGSSWSDAAAAVTCRQLGLANGTAKFVGPSMLEAPPPESGIPVPDYFFQVCDEHAAHLLEVVTEGWGITAEAVPW